jgi:hypothetical protein
MQLECHITKAEKRAIFNEETAKYAHAAQRLRPAKS